MKYKGRKGSTNVEDRRGMGGKTLLGGGIGGLIIVLIITFMGGNPGEILNNLGATDTEQNVPYEQTTEEKELAGVRIGRAGGHGGCVDKSFCRRRYDVQRAETCLIFG